MTVRYLLLAVLGVALAGCETATDPAALRFAPSPKLTQDLADKPKLRDAVSARVQALYGTGPRSTRVPAGAPLTDGGRLLANRFVDASQVVTASPAEAAQPVQVNDPATGKPTTIAGGYALYRKNCLHCHGVQGDGNGPTAAFLWPKPRDFRPGIYKFTSTSTDKPTRDDLRRTLLQGIPNTSMPSFEALLTPLEIEQVLDYTIYLSLRGQTEQRLAEEATFDETVFEDPAAADELAQQVADQILGQWKTVDQGGELEVLDPGVPRTPSTTESITRGKALFLGQTAEKLQCAGCHGNQAKGDGPSFVPVEVFNEVVFRGRSIETFDEATRRLWTEGSLDVWGNPLRPGNLNNGERTYYKGGRRPIDLYWRIAKGIGGAKMPAHNTAIKPDQIWDLVNFVLALPYQADLLKDAPPNPPVATPAAVAVRE